MATTTHNPTDEQYAAEVAAHCAAQAQLLEQLRERTADRPAHAVLLGLMLTAGTEDEVLELAETPGRGVSGAVADALADDVIWGRFAEPPRRGWFTSGAPRAYAEHRTAQARAAAARKATQAERERYENSLEGMLARALTPPSQRRR